MRRVFVELSEDSFERLSLIAWDERRGVKDQAAVILETALRETERRSESAECEKVVSHA
jgi:hypothetical protein